MQRKNYCLFVFIVLLFSCNSEEKSTSSQDVEFENFKNIFIANLWKQAPSWATALGYHKYDSMMLVPDADQRASDAAFFKSYKDSLRRFDIQKLSASNRIDYNLIENEINYELWATDTLREWEWNPSVYNISDMIAMVLDGKQSTLEARLSDISKKLKNARAYYKAAIESIKTPAIEHTDLAILQNQGCLSVLQQIKDSLSVSNLNDADEVVLNKRIEEAVIAVNDYINWLNNDLKPTLLTEKSARSFRLGKDLYMNKFKYAMATEYSADEIYKIALQQKGALHSKMLAISKQLWPQYFKDKAMPENELDIIRKMIDTLSYQHVHRDSFMAAIKTMLPRIVNFINEQNLIYMDPQKPLLVRATPLYMQGVAGASMSSPGPYEQNNNAYYNVTPLTNYSAEAAESYLREYNNYLLEILSIHEALPGHYVQLMYSNQSPSLIKSIFGNSTMIEGWAVYSERMMMEEGWGNNDPALWLMYYKWNLRACCNTILDYSVHVLGMSQEEALDLLMNQAFQQKAEAEGKWRRVQLTSVQLCSYFTGYREIYEFREELKKRSGDKFNLKEFHEKFLSYGSAPVKDIKKLMMEE
jgi:uncharacterized protein (DUF885 family)